jgi:hypothetical protein
MTAVGGVGDRSVGVLPVVEKRQTVSDRVIEVLQRIGEPFTTKAVADCVASYVGYLDWTDRLSGIQKKISDAYGRLSKSTSSKWNAYNGGYDYAMCGVQEDALVKAVIESAPATQKEFYFLDVGAANFEWVCGRWMGLPDLKPGITVHVIGVRGEKYEGKQTTSYRDGAIVCHRIGCFKIEEIASEFDRLGFSLEGSVDLVVSKWTLRHLVDPVGTFAQIYNLLRPKTGRIFFDGFYFLSQDNALENEQHNEAMVALLNDLGAPFLLTPNLAQNALFQFVLRRPNGEPCQLNMAYAGLTRVGYFWDIAGGCVTRFTKPKQDAAIQEGTLVCEDIGFGTRFLYGDRDLFDWFFTRQLFVGSWSIAWAPIQIKI